MTIQTEHLFIRPMILDDWLSVREIGRDFRAGPYALYDHPLPETDVALQEVVRFFAKSGAVYSVLLRENGTVIGYICLWPEKDMRELGYCFHSKWHGKGLAYESIHALMDHIRGSEQVSAVVCGTALCNAPSMRLIRRLGFRQISTETASFYKDTAGNDIVFASGVFRKDLSD